MDDQSSDVNLVLETAIFHKGVNLLDSFGRKNAGVEHCDTDRHLGERRAVVNETVLRLGAALLSCELPSVGNGDESLGHDGQANVHDATSLDRALEQFNLSFGARSVFTIIDDSRNVDCDLPVVAGKDPVRCPVAPVCHCKCYLHKDEPGQCPTFDQSPKAHTHEDQRD